LNIAAVEFRQPSAQLRGLILSDRSVIFHEKHENNRLLAAERA
jgi:hypothetical protein